MKWFSHQEFDNAAECWLCGQFADALRDGRMQAFLSVMTEALLSHSDESPLYCIVSLRDLDSLLIEQRCYAGVSADNPIPKWTSRTIFRRKETTYADWEVSLTERRPGKWEDT